MSLARKAGNFAQLMQGGNSSSGGNRPSRPPVASRGQGSAAALALEEKSSALRCLRRSGAPPTGPMLPMPFFAGQSDRVPSAVKVQRQRLESFAMKRMFLLSAILLPVGLGMFLCWWVWYLRSIDWEPGLGLPLFPWSDPRYVVSEFKPNTRTAITLLAGVDNDGSTVYYNITRDGVVVDDDEFAYCDPVDAACFSLLQADGGLYFAIVESDNPNVALVLYDVEKGLVWPSNRNDSYTLTASPQRETLSKLQATFKYLIPLSDVDAEERQHWTVYYPHIRY